MCSISFKGPWLQLPLELLESLLVLNVDPVTLSAADYRMSPPTTSSSKRRELSPPPSPRGLHLTVPSQSGRPTPPPIDPGVFKSVTTIRRLIDEASDLAVRAASGLSAVALGSIRSPGMGGGLGGNGSGNNPWTTAQSLGLNPLSDQGLGSGGGVGRSVSMSAMRTHRLRTLAVQRLAAAYKADEIAASVMVMQGASALDDVAERVLKIGMHQHRYGSACALSMSQSRITRMRSMFIFSMKRFRRGEQWYHWFAPSVSLILTFSVRRVPGSWQSPRRRRFWTI